MKNKFIHSLLIKENKKMEILKEAVSYAIDAGMIFGPCIGFVSQMFTFLQISKTLSPL